MAKEVASLRTPEGIVELAEQAMPWWLDAAANEDFPTTPLGVFFIAARPDVVAAAMRVVAVARMYPAVGIAKLDAALRAFDELVSSPAEPTEEEFGDR